MKTKIVNFFELYREACEENIEEVERSLESAGIDYEKSLERTRELIKREKAKLKTEEGLEKKRRWQEDKIIVTTNSVSDTQLYYAFRKKQDLSDEDMNEIKKDIQLLNELEKREETKN